MLATLTRDSRLALHEHAGSFMTPQWKEVCDADWILAACDAPKLVQQPNQTKPNHTRDGFHAGRAGVVSAG
jgi:hypothetical protein